MTDNQNWLAEYAQTGSDAAFRELVTRYVDLVYSTALRLVGGDAHRAEDVAQTVFINLARVARTLPKDVKLGGWLHRDTCFTASTLLRGERRRQARERQAAEMNALQNTTADYSLVAPVLDEAINELGDADRTAILLRFFEQNNFRSVGAALGSNEDAARMRVTRALEKLEDYLKRRGITTTAASLGVVLSANAVQAAPVGLALTISTAAALTGTTLATTATVTATKAIAMTALQKTIVTATIAVLAGAGIYEARQASQLRDQIKTLQQQQAAIAGQAEALQRERDEMTKRLASMSEDNERLNRNTTELLKLRGEVTRLRSDLRQSAQVATDKQSNTNSELQIPTLTLARRLSRIEEHVRQHPEEIIPELQFAGPNQWMNAVLTPMEDDAGLSSALFKLRNQAQSRFIQYIREAERQFEEANNGQFPSDLSQLEQYFEPSIGKVVRENYAIAPASVVKDPNARVVGDWIIVRKTNVNPGSTVRLAVFKGGASGWYNSDSRD